MMLGRYKMLIEVLIDYFKSLLELCLLGFELTLSLSSVIIPIYIFCGAFSEFKKKKIGNGILNIVYGILLFLFIGAIIVGIEYFKGILLWNI